MNNNNNNSEQKDNTLISKPTFNESQEVSTISNWDELDLHEDILRGIYNYGFEKPSPIQCKAIKPIIDKFDIIAQAQSGTGKTATFCIGTLARIDVTKNATQAMIMAPTHELSKQITNVIQSLSSMMNGIRIQTIIGGGSINVNAETMNASPPHIIVGCPGRIQDLIKRKYINVSSIKIVVLDEADEMLSTGFKDQIYNIFKFFNKHIQIVLFSATLPPHIHDITSRLMHNPVTINVARESLTLEGIKQYYIAINDDREKYQVLKELYNLISVSQCIIYCNSVKRVIDLTDAMREDTFPVCCIHSNMTANERECAFEEFKSGAARVLISSNVTARGIDIQQVSVVINFDIPRDIQTYLHRIGRSGRWGRKGTGINFITRRDIQKIKEIEEYYQCQIDEFPNNFTT